MQEADQLRGAVAQVREDVAANQAASLGEIQQVLDALASANQNATDLDTLKAAVTDARTQLEAIHTMLSETTAWLTADDPRPASRPSHRPR